MALPSNTSIAIRTIWRYSIFALCCGVIPGCSKAPKETRSAADTVAVTDTARPEDPLDQFVSYDVVENKSLAATCYDLPHIKEWYAKRILPPPFNFAVDLSGKGYADLRLLRNEIYARNGYLFRDAAMRAHFNRFTWYQPIFDAPEFRVQIDAQEKAFLDRVTAREQEELRQREIDVQGNTMVNLKHVVNFDQFADLDEPLRAALRERNMAIVPAAHDQLFSLYDENQYSFIPNFITPDLFLQLLHKYLSSLMKGIEDKQLIRTVDALVGALYS